MPKAQIDAVVQMITIPDKEPPVAEQRAAMEQMAAAFPSEAQRSEASEMGGVPCEWILTTQRRTMWCCSIFTAGAIDLPP